MNPRNPEKGPVSKSANDARVTVTPLGEEEARQGYALRDAIHKLVDGRPFVILIGDALEADVLSASLTSDELRRMLETAAAQLRAATIERGKPVCVRGPARVEVVVEPFLDEHTLAVLRAAFACTHANVLTFDVDALGGHYDVKWCEDCGAIRDDVDQAWKAPRSAR